jgi:hypothetical protein
MKKDWKTPVRENTGAKNGGNRSREAAEAFTGRASLHADPLGSYTGRAEGADTKPAQDADDL